MKKKNDYLSPELEIILLELCDIVTSSTQNPDPDTGGNNGGGYEGSDDTDW